MIILHPLHSFALTIHSFCIPVYMFYLLWRDSWFILPALLTPIKHRLYIIVISIEQTKIGFWKFCQHHIIYWFRFIPMNTYLRRIDIYIYIINLFTKDWYIYIYTYTYIEMKPTNQGRFRSQLVSAAWHVLRAAVSGWIRICTCGRRTRLGWWL